MKLNKAEKELLEDVFRRAIAELQGEQYRAEKETGKKFPAYDNKIEQIRNLYSKVKEN